MKHMNTAKIDDTTPLPPTVQKLDQNIPDASATVLHQ